MRIEQACERAGRKPMPISIMTGVVVGADEAELRERAARLAQRGSAGDPDRLLSDPPPGWIVGTLDAAAEQLGALREAGVARVMCQHLLHDDLDAIALIAGQLAPHVA
jgi:alkanesulfonate monooxygenase SsuD/methylene tetrahydromethanopterin reductase-like flavin-dependent oxidoreductase (luciferase family)